MSVRIGYLNQDFVPETGAGPARLLEMGRRWQATGADVTVLCGMPNRRIPGRGEGEVAAQYQGRFSVTEEWEGIRTVRSWVYATPRQGFVSKVINNLSFLATGLMVGPWVFRQHEVLIASSPPFFPHISGALLASWHRMPLVLEVRDLWPDYLVAMGLLSPGGLASRALLALESALLRRADAVVVVTESFRRRIVDKGVARERVHVIPNGVDLGAYRSVAAPPMRERFADGPGPIVGYLGTFGRGQALRTVVEAAARLHATRPDVQVVLVGDGPDRPDIIRSIAQSGARVSVLPTIRREETQAFYNACDVCLVPLAPIPIFQETVPSKLFEVMACERPIVASVGGEAAGIVTASGAGLVAPPGDADALAAAVLQVLALPPEARTAMGAKGRAYVAQHFNRETLADRYLALLEGVVEASASRSAASA